MAPKSTLVKLAKPAKNSGTTADAEPAEAETLKSRKGGSGNKKTQVRARQRNSINTTKNITIEECLEKTKVKQISNQDGSISDATKIFKASRSPSVIRQIDEASNLKSILIAQIKKELPLALRNKTSPEYGLLRSIELSNESFDAIVAPKDPSEIDRSTSMLPGPFFTSEVYPIPVGKNGKPMTPIVQIDLGWASSFLDERLGDNLVQVWYDRAKFEGYLRVIPRKLLNASNMTDFGLKTGKRYDTFPVPHQWESYLQGGNVSQIVDVKSRGIRSQTSHLELYREELPRGRLSNELIQSLKSFEKITQYEHTDCDSPLRFGGTFCPIQYSAVDANRPCLLAANGDWGASGGAQIFYEISSEGLVDFQFWNCLR